MPKEDKLDLELQDSLKDIIRSCEQEDDEIRKLMTKTWKKHEEFWHGVQHLFWSERDGTWRRPADVALDGEFSDDELAELGSFYDFVIDIFKAHGESIIAALSAQVPGLRFLPDDADEEIDVTTARSYNKVGDLVQRHNKAKLIFLKALFFLYIHGVVFSYRYKDSDFAYGSVDVPQYGTQEVAGVNYTCKECDYTAPETWSECPQCGSEEAPKEEQTVEEVPTVIKTTAFPKTRSIIEVYGALHVKVPVFARNQKEFEYLGFYSDVSKSVAQDEYPDLYDEIEGEHLTSTERFSRTEYSYPIDPGVDEKNLVTISKWWLRRAAFSREKDKRKRELLRKKYPDGIRVTLIGNNRVFVSATAEKLDDRWEAGQSGLATFFYTDAICRPVVPLQEMKNQVGNLSMETIDHGIPSMFADPKVLSFDEYGKFENTPGFVYKAKPRTPTSRIGDSFYTMDRATLSAEVPIFDKSLDQSAQFALGSFPSVYGGPAEGKTRTFGEYSASRQMALQRLSIVWTFVVDWWVRTIHGCAVMYVESMAADEHYSKEQDGGYINIFIRQSELKGKIGGVEPEGAEGFPLSLMQKKDLIFKLMEMQNQFVDAALYTPENARVIQDVMAMNEFKIPGESQRVKQIIEINRIIKGIPVSVDPDVDDHAVHIQTIRAYLVDTSGLDLMDTKPEAYEMCKEHLHEHEQALLMKTMQAAGGSPAGVEPQSAATGVSE